MLQFLPLASYLFVMAVTPGPNNIMLAVSGANFGFRRTMPHLLGICLGNMLQMTMCASLLAAASGWIDGARRGLAVAGCAYLLWLAWKISRAGAPGTATVLKPMKLVEGALFQAINPKAWMLVINAVVLFMPRGGGWKEVSTMVVVGLLVGFPSIAIWALGGAKLRLILQRPAALRIFNLTMAILLAATAIVLLVDEL